MKKDLTEIVFILDESGSMSDLASDTIGGFNSLITKQKAEKGEALVSAVMFSDKSRVVYDRVPLDRIRKMTGKDYCPGGCTALLDAVGSAVKHISDVHKYAREEDRPEHTIFIITTDGMENASHVYSSSKVKSMISEKQEKYGWEFVFMAANIDAVETAEHIGIVRENAVNYMADREGTAVVYGCINEAVINVRKGRGLAKNAVWRKDADKDMAERKR